RVEAVRGRHGVPVLRCRLHPDLARPGRRDREGHLAGRPRRDAREPLRQGPVRLRVRPEPEVMARYQILYWQDVPSVIKAFDDTGETKRQLADWYQQEIDKRAMVQGLTGSDEYLEQWRWGELEERPGTPDEVLDAVERELEA